jgi:hypothetical protein
MTSSATSPVLSEKRNLDSLSAGTRAYFRNRTKNRLYNLVLMKFRQEADAGRLTQAKLARRMGKKPEVVNRLLASPSNWGLETLSDLLLAIAGEEIDDTSSDPEARPAHNARSRDRFKRRDAAPPPPPKTPAANGGKVLELTLSYGR